jgi:hypothetical protein
LPGRDWELPLESQAKLLRMIQHNEFESQSSSHTVKSEALNVDLGEIFRSVQIEDSSKRKSMVLSLIRNADDEQLKLAFKILSALIQK